MDIFAKSRELDKQLSDIIFHLRSGGGTEDSHIEFKACALASQTRKVHNSAPCIAARLQANKCFVENKVTQKVTHLVRPAFTELG